MFWRDLRTVSLDKESSQDTSAPVMMDGMACRTVPLGRLRRVFVGVLGPEFSEQGIVCAALRLVRKSQ